MYYFTKVFKSKWKRMMKVIEQKAKWRNVRDVSTFTDLARTMPEIIYTMKAKVTVNDV